jgi:chemotaxis protein MotB
VARKKKGGGEHGGHGWFVTFADLMALLMSFFVMVAAYSTQDQKKLQLVAGSMRDAFGVSKESRYSGIVEMDGLPVADGKVKNTRAIPPEQSTDQPSPPSASGSTDTPIDRLSGRNTGANLAAASIRQALQSMPEVAELTKHVVFEQTPDGLNISLVDHDGRSMFGTGSAKPYERLRMLLETIAPTLRRFSQRISVTGHTATPKPGQSPEGPAWDLSTSRATAARQILADAGIPDDRFSIVAGKGDTEPMFPDNPFIPANRRVTVTLLKEAPPIPPSAQP